MKKLILPAFALMIVAQWAIPIKTIIDSEAVLQDGTTWRFKTQPVDPSDPFRGKYVVLSFEADQFEDYTLTKYDEGETVYAELAEDSLGFATVTKLHTKRPDDLTGKYLKTKVRYSFSNNGKQRVTLDFSFDRFYVEESKASDTERVYWNAQRDSTLTTYAFVKVNKGQAIIENVMINDRPILEIVRELNEKEIHK
jgi:uncharacterized membrane-anchored protein